MNRQVVHTAAPTDRLCPQQELGLAAETSKQQRSRTKGWVRYAWDLRYVPGSIGEEGPNTDAAVARGELRELPNLPYMEFLYSGHHT